MQVTFPDLLPLGIVISVMIGVAFVVGKIAKIARLDSLVPFLPPLRRAILGITWSTIVGCCIAGIGARVAMRIIAVVSGEVVEFSLNGTLFILSLGGFVGLLGGLFYVLVRRWIPGKGIWKGLAYGAILLLVFGGLPVKGAAMEFASFSFPLLSDGLFAVVFVLYGLVASLAIERCYRNVPAVFAKRWVSIVGYVIIGGLCLLGLVFHIVALQPLLQGIAF